MCKGGNKTTQTTSNQVDPEQMKLFMQNYNSAQQVANTPFQSYTGERVAPANPTLNQSFDMFGNIAANNTGAQTLASAADALRGLGGYTPQSVQPQALSQTDLSPYMNPFTSNVIDTTLSDLERSRQMAQMADAQKATAAGAFGGSRSGVMGAETNRAYDQNAASTLANLNLQNFNQAQSAATGDITRALQAAQGNQNADIAGAGLRSNAANGLAGISNQELSQALQRAGALNQVGAQQESIQQQMDDAAYEEFLRQIAYPTEQQQLRNQSLGLIPIQQTTTGTTRQSQSIWNNYLDYLNTMSKFIPLAK